MKILNKIEEEGFFSQKMSGSPLESSLLVVSHGGGGGGEGSENYTIKYIQSNIHPKWHREMEAYTNLP